MGTNPTHQPQNQTFDDCGIAGRHGPAIEAHIDAGDAACTPPAPELERASQRFDHELESETTVIDRRARNENGHGSEPSSGGLAVALWLLAIVLCQYLFICWALLRAGRS